MGSYRRHHPQDTSIAVAIYPTAAFKESLKSPPLERDHDQARTLKPLTRPVRPRNEQRSNDKRQTPAHASSSRPSRAWEHWQHEMWELFGEGELETVSIGRRRFVVESLDAYIARLRARAAERREGRPQQTEMRRSKAARAAPAYAGSDPRIDDGDRRGSHDQRRAPGCRGGEAAIAARLPKAFTALADEAS
jgi:hypothetical protein